jgi:phage shock protein A
MGDISLAIERAETKTETLRAKAGAIDELVTSGVLDDPTSGKDSLDHQLEQVSASASVEAELASLKGSLPSGQKKSLPEGQS